MEFSEVLGLLLTIIAGFTTYFLVPFLKRKTTAAQQELICFLAMIAVDAVEKIMENEPGKDKLEYVKDFLQSKGFELTETEI